MDLIVRELSDNDLALDLESLNVNGRRYAVATDSVATGSGQKDGIGINRRTAECVGGGALLGTIIGAIAGRGEPAGTTQGEVCLRQRLKRAGEVVWHVGKAGLSIGKHCSPEFLAGKAP